VASTQDAPGVWGGNDKDKKGGTANVVLEAVSMILAYAKQETVGPMVKALKSLGKGLAGASALALGTVLLALGLLRALETELGSAPAVTRASATGHLSGSWSWVPYAAAAGFCFLVVAWCVGRIVRGVK
jgi:hypothetical protein